MDSLRDAIAGEITEPKFLPNILEEQDFEGHWNLENLSMLTEELPAGKFGGS